MAASFGFYFLAGLILASAFLAVMRRKPGQALVFFVLTLLATAGVFLQLRAPLLALLEILLCVVGCGLLLRSAASRYTSPGSTIAVPNSLQTWLTVPAVVALCGVGALLLFRARRLPGQGVLVNGAVPAEQLPRNTTAFAHALMTSYLLPVGAAGVLLVIVLLGLLSWRKGVAAP
jgi:NADH:ubiquinone oxidoreductase subunit 6 (subunit J)